MATYISFPLTDISGNAVEASANPDSEIDNYNDGAAPNGFVDCTNESVALGSGNYYLSLSQAEMNYDYIDVIIKSDDAVTQHMKIRTIIGDPLNLATTAGGVAVWSSASRALTTPADYKADVTGINDLSTGITALQTDLDNPSQYMANVASLALEATLNTHNDKLVEVSGGVIDILVDTSTTIPGTITTMQADLDDPAQYKADVSLLALEVTTSGIWSLPSRELSTPANYKADISTLALEATVSGIWSLPTRALTTPNDYKADVSSLATSGMIAPIQVDLDNPAQYKADVSLLSLETTVSGIWSLSNRTLTTPGDYMAVITGLALETSITALNDPTTKEIDDYLTGLHGAGSWEGGGAAPTTGEIATGVWGYVSKALTTPGDYMANVTGINDLSGYIAPIQVDLDTPTQYMANVSTLALESSVSGVQAEIDKPDNYKADVSLLSLEATVSGVWSLPTRALTTPSDYKADVGELANISGYIAPLQVDLDNPNQFKADVSTLSTSGNVAASYWCGHRRKKM